MSVTIGKAIKIIREAKGSSLRNLAAQAKVSTPYLSLLESGKRNPSLDVVKRLAVALDIPLEVMLLIAAGENTTLRSDNDLAGRLMSIINKMELYEQRIKDAIQFQDG